MNFSCYGDGIKAKNMKKGNGDPLLHMKCEVVSLLCGYPFKIFWPPTKLTTNSLTRPRRSSETRQLSSSPPSFPINRYPKFCSITSKGVCQAISLPRLFPLLECPPTCHTLLPFAWLTPVHL